MSHPSLEYYERFWATETEDPCRVAKEALREWARRHLGDPLIVTDYRPQSRGKRLNKVIWIIYGRGRVYYATLICRTNYAEVRVSERKGSEKGMIALAREALARGRLREFPELSAYLR